MYFMIFYLTGSKGNVRIFPNEGEMLVEVSHLLSSKKCPAFLVIRQDDPLYNAGEDEIEAKLLCIRRGCLQRKEEQRERPLAASTKRDRQRRS